MVTKPKLRTEAPLACASRSITIMRFPRRAAARACARPQISAPTMARSYEPDFGIAAEQDKNGTKLSTALKDLPPSRWLAKIADDYDKVSKRPNSRTERNSSFPPPAKV